MIPEADAPLSLVEQRRWELTRLAAVLAEAGVPADLILLDARDGIGIVARRHARSGR